MWWLLPRLCVELASVISVMYQCATVHVLWRWNKGNRTGKWFCKIHLSNSMSVNTEFLYFSPLLAGYTLYCSRCRLRVFVSRLTSIEYSEQGSLDTLRCYSSSCVAFFSSGIAVCWLWPAYTIDRGSTCTRPMRRRISPTNCVEFPWRPSRRLTSHAAVEFFAAPSPSRFISSFSKQSLKSSVNLNAVLFLHSLEVLTINCNSSSCNYSSYSIVNKQERLPGSKLY